MKDILNDLVKIVTIILLFISAYVMKQYRIELENKGEQIKILEQSLQEQIQEKEVYMKMLEREGKEWNYLKEKKHLKKHQIE